ncbi:MAG: NAD(P)H-hydrate dehydratase [Oscillospiraceae bacterium]|nr:NAD(P)H-hydrate dehydratase [Oscillospiraceae bacterium]
MQLVAPLEMMKLEEQANKQGVTYDMMMDTAGNGLAEHLIRIAGKYQVTSLLFLCGNGNNAGDCFVAANRLSGQFSVTVGLVAGIPKTRTAYTKYRMMQNVNVITEQAKIEEAIRKHTLIVDGVFGIGFRGELTPAIQHLFSLIDEPEKHCIAVDIPSGGSGLNGSVAAGTPVCDETITFGAAKPGLFLSPLLEHCGKIRLVDIGIPQEILNELSFPVTIIDEERVGELLPKRPMSGHKGMFGRLLCVTGSRNMPGAAILSARAALRSGVGTVCVASEINVCKILVGNTPECMLLPLPTDQDGKMSQLAAAPILEYIKTGCASVLIGCGIGQSDTLRHMIPTLITQIEIPIILDADGLNALANSIDMLQKAKAPVILTPHPAEMARLLHTTTEEVQKDRIGAAKRLAAKFPKAIVVLKGAGTIIAQADRAFISTTGNSGMSKGGSGDVLAGMIAGLTAQGIPPLDAAQIGVFLHGLAGERCAEDLSRRAMLPTDLIEHLPEIFADYE